MILGAPCASLFFTALDARGSLLHRLPIYSLAALSLSAMIASMAKGLSVYRRVRRAKGMACPRCLYELSWEGNRCPECGRDYTPDQVRTAWRSENVPF